ncbi:non-ribosomal peptide synthetase [Nocardioides rubriscoriae]|uniref:non-ribosomal peptide synthetase n=1 Tax=Nocardioides rubriscoriae TaxID=642762 RepID=UPI001FE7FDA1|nr:non-ribosomal peptide synthetase [Nocardioides rubriscoriae]
MTTRPVAPGPTTRPRRGHALPLLGGAPEAVALVTPEGTTTYAELAAAVRATVEALGPSRRLVLLEATRDLRTVVTYLACLAGGHPVLVVGQADGARADDIRATYAPDVVATPAGLQVTTRPHDRDDLHPDLAQLLSTSGSTGSPKLVRLSLDNVVSNAHAIADYLRLSPRDRAITSLPLHYCYGLSVLTSHLAAGAGVVLTELSVADECFWDLVAEHRVTGVAGVPHTFEVLEASGFAERDLPSLRYVTQAGGRLAPERVTRFAQLGQRRGWDLVVMYGQTEATARMAYLPPDLAAGRPTAIGVPVPGGSLRVDPVEGLDPDDLADGVGELVYAGPNVMMGYATSPADLARGPELTELRTGDLGRRAPDGMWEVTGRLGRQRKVLGLRLDLDRLEQQADVPTAVVVHDDALHAFVTRSRVAHRVRARLVARTGLPPGAVRVHRLERLPLTGSGKVDHAALARHAAALAEARAGTPTPAPRVSAASLRDLYAAVLGRPDATPDDTFVSLGGDSLSFVEVSTRLSQVLGHLPSHWQALPIRDLAATARRPRRHTTSLELPVVIRAVAIVMILATHADLVLVPGGAHVLLAVVGFNLARFPLAVAGRRRRAGRLLASAAAVAVPASLWIGGCVVLVGDYRPATAFFLNGLLGDQRWTPDWQLWFLEVVVWVPVGLAALLAVPAFDRLQRARPFATPLALAVGALALRYVWTGVTAGPTERYSVPLVLWCVAAGWAAAEARTTPQRLAVGAFAVVASHGFFADPQREAVVAVGLALLLWGRPVRLPAPLAAVVRLVAAASLWIYLTQWQVYPDLEDAGHPYLAVLASVAVGVAAYGLHRRTSAGLGWAWRTLRPRRHENTPAG